MTHWILIGLGILIVLLTVVAVLDLLPPLRIVPDNTHFDFTRFRRINETPFNIAYEVRP